MIRFDTETKQITHAIGIAAYNAETTLARNQNGRYARAGDEAHALTREALTTPDDVQPGPAILRNRLDPLTAPRRTKALADLCDLLNAAQARFPGTNLVLRYEVKLRPALHDSLLYVRSPGIRFKIINFSKAGSESRLTSDHRGP